ncbi:hypothetical protein DOTSEDRAFT_26547 [Dothistroma septosporum NZE10]|uniref:Uncharacterized protein n=1 Tax=Dothistroma septosporum (strain NZE10 / CBS 128990) TaxID=675120 RepID=N1PJ64_DOTSN|nr:hypothetical protein DOTSEDRAFT_26547 [Dothistroma septosporum NZE10]
MSRGAPYQWICLRAIKPRTPIRNLATETSSNDDSRPAPDPSTSSPPTTSDLKSYLQTQDTAFLKATQNHLTTMQTTAQTIHNVSRTLSQDASRIQILENLPPYTTYTFRPQHLNPTMTSQKLLSQISTLNDNLTDLLYTPYPSDTGPSKAEKFKKKLSEWTYEEKAEELEDLKAAEMSHAGRLVRGTEGLKKHVEELEKMGRRGRGRGNPFGRGKEEDGEIKREEGKKGVGYGAGGTDIKASGEEGGMMPNPFVRSVKEKEKKAAVESAKSKGKRATDAVKGHRNMPTAVADAVDVPKSSVRRSLADVQAALSRSLEEKK